jgi:hypothetical protein
MYRLVASSSVNSASFNVARASSRTASTQLRVQNG